MVYVKTIENCEVSCVNSGKNYDATVVEIFLTQNESMGFYLIVKDIKKRCKMFKFPSTKFDIKD